jgi:anti-anti-sigma factor
VPFSIREQPHDEGCVVEVSGDIDSAASDTLAAALESAAGVGETNPLVIVDLSGANFLDSRSIGILADWQARMRATGGRLALAGARPEVVRLFEMIGLEQTFEFYADTATARAGSGPRAN